MALLELFLLAQFLPSVLHSIFYVPVFHGRSIPNPDFPEISACAPNGKFSFVMLSNGTLLDAKNESRDLTKYWDNQTKQITIPFGTCSGIIQDVPRFK